MVIEAVSMREFFRESLTTSLQRARVSVSEHVQLYLVQLLTEFGRADAVFAGGDEEKPVMVDMINRAQEADPQEAVRIYKHMGDRSLYLTGFFAGAVEKAVVGRGFYVSMGGQAYAQVSSLVRSSTATTAALFAEMSDRFEALVRVLESMSLQPVANGQASNDDVLEVYERFQRTGNEQAKEALQRRGIIVDRFEN
jgi:hypothetical protein